MNPPFRLGPPSLFYGSSDPSALTYNPLEVSSAFSFIPGQDPEGQAHFTARFGSHFVSRVAIQSNFSDRLILNLHAGARFPISDWMSLEATGTAGVGFLFNQQRTQGQLSENISRDGITGNLGLELRLNSQLTPLLGMFTSISYQREFPLDVRTDPERLAYSRQNSNFEGDNIVALSAGVSFGFFGSRSPDNAVENTRSETPRYNQSLIEVDLERNPEPSMNNLEDAISERLGRDFRTYIDQLQEITHMNRYELYRSANEILNDENADHLSVHARQIVILEILNNSTPNYQRTRTFLRNLNDTFQSINEQRSANEMVESFTHIANSLSLPLHRRTLVELERIIRSSYQQNRSPSETYESARDFLYGAYLNQTLNPYAQRMVREYVMDEARRYRIPATPISNFNPPVITIHDDRIDRYCRSDVSVEGCAFTNLPANQRTLTLSHSRTPHPNNAFETLVHENAHLFAGRMREVRGLNSHFAYTLGRSEGRFPYWLEEALNQQAVHDILRRNNLNYTSVEAHSNGREALIQINNRYGEESIEAWKIMGLFGSADAIHRIIGRNVFRGLTVGYESDDHEGRNALIFIRRQYHLNS